MRIKLIFVVALFLKDTFYRTHARPGRARIQNAQRGLPPMCSSFNASGAPQRRCLTVINVVTRHVPNELRKLNIFQNSHIAAFPLAVRTHGCLECRQALTRNQAESRATPCCLYMSHSTTRQIFFMDARFAPSIETGKAFVAGKGSLQAGGLAAISRRSAQRHRRYRTRSNSRIPAGCQDAAVGTAAIGSATLPSPLASRRDAECRDLRPPVVFAALDHRLMA